MHRRNAVKWLQRLSRRNIGMQTNQSLVDKVFGEVDEKQRNHELQQRLNSNANS